MPEKPIHPALHALDVILHKRDGLVLTDAEINYFVRAVVDHTATDAQIAAFLMAVFQRGLTPQELATLTTAMRFSGETFDSSFLNAFCVDKHSTGGVGDKTSLLIAPIVAAAGLKVPMISGRSLGHTGGTLDKLETIPGFRTQLSMTEFAEIIAKCGFFMAGQTPALVPADRILYGLRDHTGTVESPNLICASIMSKKLAEGINGLVLDVKTGSGAFMTKYEDARHLASLMVSTGELAGTRTVALMTAMDEPLGRFSGNWVEVWECVDVLKNVRHPMSADLVELTNILAGWMLYLGGKSSTPQTGATLSNDLLTSGAAYKTWLAMVELQGGDTSVFGDPAAFHKSANTLSFFAEGGGSASSSAIASRTLTASESGYLYSMDCREVGWAVQRLGAGRAKPGDPVSAYAGIEVHAKLGTRIEPGQPLVTLFAESESLLAEPYEMLRATYRISPGPPTPNTLIREVITS